MVHVLGFVSVQRRIRVCLVIGLGFGQFLCLVVSLEHWNTVNFYAFSIFETDGDWYKKINALESSGLLSHGAGFSVVNVYIFM